MLDGQTSQPANSFLSMNCTNCHAENPAAFTHCGECGLSLFLAVLKEIGEPRAVKTHYIFAPGATIGRHPDNVVNLQDPSLSRFHARIDYQHGRFYIQDLSSSNGVFVNDVKVRRREIRDFDRLALGATMLLFRTGAPSLRATSPLLQTQEEFLAAVSGMNQRAQSAAFSHEVLEIAARFAIKITRAERAVIFLYDNQRALQPAVFHNVTHSDVQHDEFDVSRSALQEAEDTGEMVIREACLADPRYQSNHSIQTLQLNTILCLPLKSSRPLATMTLPEPETGKLPTKGVMFGVLYLDSRRTLKGMPQHRRTMLQVLADQIALTIENMLLQKEMQEKRQINKQMRAAKDVQQRLFPPPNFSHPHFTMAYHYAPAQHIGGDYLAFQPLSETRFLLAMGDVVGKGLPAGLVVMTVHGGLYSEISHQAELLPIVRSLDRLIYEYTQGKVFVTFFAGIFDLTTKRLEYTSAGHNPPLLYCRTAQKWHELAARGVPLGVAPDAERRVESIPLESGDLLTLYTDGITEARDAAQKQFGKEGLKKVLSHWLLSPHNENPPLHELVNTVLARLQHFTNYQPLEDDTTLMAVSVK